MNRPPQQEKPKRDNRFIRQQLTGSDGGCLRGLLVFIGLLLIFGAILFVMSQV